MTRLIQIERKEQQRNCQMHQFERTEHQIERREQQRNCQMHQFEATEYQFEATELQFEAAELNLIHLGNELKLAWVQFESTESYRYHAVHSI